ncbi:DUF1302 domain-containing protein [Acinetobacter sp. ANC 4910]|uniref:DUF1302 domain-containing protein n=1 Tax=Acinetobacter sp. ANC 4910 TaxID=2529850 RepID=UPI00103E65EA|nr:DUF1302 domain-containing protein [Acinetobacter sp. ANC 4910]TCB33844.1 DUF1302 domain-containing protein [Acinetobacter sp. ANC 4910]
MVSQFVSLNRQNHHISLMKKTVLCLSLALVISEVSAASFDLNEDWKFETNTTLSLGANWSTQNASAALVYKPDANHIGKTGSSIDVNGDDGRVNFSKNDVISEIIKGYTEFKLQGKRSGAVLSTKYWYDHAYETGHGDLKAYDDSEWPRLAKFKGIELWDAYIWTTFEAENGEKLKLNLGKHTLNWGKSQFFFNGLNSVSAFDYAGMTRPGVDSKERVIPVEMFSFQAEVNKNLKFDGFYQFKFRPTVVDGCGTFFAISDFVPEHCGPIILTVMPGDKLSETALEAQTMIPRSDSRYAKDNGQYGFSLKQTLTSLNNAELGFYFANFHSRNANFDGTAVTALGPANFDTAQFFSIYPEDIKMYGLSLSGKFGTTSVFSELTHKPNQPLQLNGTDIVYAQVLSNETPLTEPGLTPELGQYLQGYVRLPVTQFSVGTADSYANLLGANSLNWAAELALNHISDIGNHRFGRVGAFGRSELSSGAYNSATGEHKCTPYGTAHLSNAEIDSLNARFCNTEGFFTEWSYGYRIRGALNYKDIFPATVITPSLIFRHDVNGFSQNFQEGQMSLAAAVSATYRQKYNVELAYVNFFGSNDFSTVDDRDFASLAFKVNF